MEEDRIMQYIEIKDNIVVDHCCSNKIPSGSQYKQVTDFNAYVGISSIALDFENGGQLKPEEELITLGVIKDTRGIYYHVETKEKIEIKKLNVEIPNSLTKSKPSEFDEWDGKKWVENLTLKKENEDNIKIYEAERYLSISDYKVIKAIEVSLSDVIEGLYPGEQAIREQKRQIIRDLREVSNA